MPKKFIFERFNYVRLHLAWSDGDKVRHRYCYVHKELLKDFRDMKSPLILGFCDKETGYYSLMDVENDS